MIVQVRGTSGSGKSTVVRRIMAATGGDAAWTPEFRDGRKRPLYYHHYSGVVVLGHYESACGGCDTIGSARAVYDLLQELYPRAEDIVAARVLCEGLLLSEDVKWSSQLPGLRVLFLNTPLERCLSQIKGRREKAGNAKELNPANTANRVATIERARGKLQDAGVRCHRVSANQAVSVVLNWLQASR